MSVDARTWLPEHLRENKVTSLEKPYLSIRERETESERHTKSVTEKKTETHEKESACIQRQ